MKHVYVITRLDIKQPHRTVQVAHGAWAARNTFGNPNEPHPNLVVCGVAGERELEEVFEDLKAKGVPVLAWSEEDMGGQMTAVASAPLKGNKERRPFKKFQLLRD